jgi:hypothetical protein
MVCFSGGIIELSHGKIIRAAVFAQGRVAILNTGMNAMTAKGPGNIRGIGESKTSRAFQILRLRINNRIKKNP